MDAIFQSHVTILIRTMQLLVAVGWLAGCAAGTHRTGLQQQLRSEAEDGVLSGGVYVDTEIAGECEVNVFPLPICVLPLCHNGQHAPVLYRMCHSTPRSHASVLCCVPTSCPSHHITCRVQWNRVCYQLHSLRQLAYHCFCCTQSSQRARSVRSASRAVLSDGGLPLGVW